ncbi:MAG: chromate transporter, partial [Cypionkella sp.]
GIAGAVTALWMTFAPCFLWIFAGAPWITRLSHAPRLSGALASITAAVVGVIASLSLWFAGHVLFGDRIPLIFGPLHLDLPAPLSLRLLPTGLALLAAYLLLLRHWPLGRLLVLCALTTAASAAFWPAPSSL